jgi:hypothetical protein
MTGRKPRCLKLVISKHGKNQCTSEQVDGSDLCAHHLARAVEDYRSILTIHTPGTEATCVSSATA